MYSIPEFVRFGRQFKDLRRWIVDCEWSIDAREGLSDLIIEWRWSNRRNGHCSMWVTRAYYGILGIPNVKLAFSSSISPWAPLRLAFSPGSIRWAYSLLSAFYFGLCALSCLVSLRTIVAFSKQFKLQDLYFVYMEIQGSRIEPKNCVYG